MEKLITSKEPLLLYEIIVFYLKWTLWAVLALAYR